MAIPRRAVTAATIAATMSCAVFTSIAFAQDHPAVVTTEPTWKLTIEIVKASISTLTVILAIIAFLIGRRDYRNSRNEAENANRLDRFKSYQEMQRKFNSEKPFITIFQYLYPEQYVGEPPIAITVAHKRDFMIFFQEVQIMIRSGLMVADLAYFAFGVDAVNFWENEQKEYKKRLAKNPAEKTPVHRDEALTLFGEFVEKTKEFQRDKKHFKDRVLGIGF